MLLALGGTCACIDAQSPPAAAANAPAAAICDADLAAQVKAALRAAPDINDTHIEVHCEDGKVVLTGLIDDNRALLDALRVATKAAKGRPILDYLWIMKDSAH